METFPRPADTCPTAGLYGSPVPLQVLQFFMTQILLVPDYRVPEPFNIDIWEDRHAIAHCGETREVISR
jgi:hypothetical protein